MNLWRSPRRRWAIIILAGGLYLLACATPTLDLTSTGDPHTHAIDWGYGDLLVGWLGIVVGFFAWFANPFFAAALILIGFRHSRAAAACALVALFFSADMLRINSIPVPADQSGSGTFVLHQALVGCYLWYAALIAAFLGALTLWLSPPPSASAPQAP